MNKRNLMNQLSKSLIFMHFSKDQKKQLHEIVAELQKQLETERKQKDSSMAEETPSESPLRQSFLNKNNK